MPRILSYQHDNMEFTYYQLYHQFYKFNELELATPLDLSLKPQTPNRKCYVSEINNCETVKNQIVRNETQKKLLPIKKAKVTRKLNFDEDNTSPVSGTIIRQLRPDENLVVRKGDIDPCYNVVEITDEAKSELAKIDNLIGDYVCQLCRELYEDAFGLAQHRCSRIVNIEYRCPECDKVFNCPANLASHRRWHRPRKVKEVKIGGGDGDVEQDTEEQFNCPDCGKRFRRIAYLKKHQSSHHTDHHHPPDHPVTGHRIDHSGHQIE